MDSQEARIFTAIIIAVIVIGTILLFFILSIVRQQKRNLRLQVSNALAEISAMERERARIANDLHDDVGPMLSVIKFQIDCVETASPEDMEDLRRATVGIDEMITRLREIAVNLMPTSLMRKGLPTAIEEFLGRVSRTAMPVTYSHDIQSELDPEKSINIFRILQEVVHNAVKHSGATGLVVELTEKENAINLFIRDNGRGFDYESMQDRSSGFGLRSLRSRVDLMQGNMIVQSKHNVGTAFLFEIPI